MKVCAATVSNRLRYGIAAFLVAGAAAANASDGHAASPKIVTLTQTGCQFLEPEDLDHGFKTQKQQDCENINAKTGDERVAKSTVLKLKAGEYVFRVTNKNVPYELGFWLRSKDYDLANPIHKLTKTSVSGGGLTTGKSREYKVTLKPGEYLYSCPLNTTPDYHLRVSGD